MKPAIFINKEFYKIQHRGDYAWIRKVSYGICFSRR